MSKVLPFLIIFSFLVVDSAQAIAVKVRPSEIKIEVEAGILAKEEITVENPDNNVALFEVYLDNFSNWVRVKPESFILEGGKSQKVVLEIENKKTGIFSTMVSVVAKPLSERKFKANSGIKIPLEVRVVKGERINFLADVSQTLIGFLNLENLVYIFSVFLILFLVGIWIKRKKGIS